MLHILRVTGDSLYPEIKEGDFVLLATSPFFLRRIRQGDIIVFHHEVHGSLIKRVTGVFPEGVYVSGTQENSLDSRRLGPIPRDAIYGKVLAHIGKLPARQ